MVLTPMAATTGINMKHSIGRTLPASTETEILIVPNGYIADLSMLFISNTSGSTGSITVYWQHAHDSNHKIYILNGTSLGSKDYIQFSNGNVVLKSGDSLKLTPTQEMNVIVTFDLVQAYPLYAFSGE